MTRATVRRARSFSLYSPAVEYGLHCILWLIGPRRDPISSRDLADFQGVSTALLAKVMPRLKKAGLVLSQDGIRGGYRLAREPHEITVLDVVDAIEAGRRIFDCREVRRGCALFNGAVPVWATMGPCAIHAAMRRAEQSMRLELAQTTLLDLANQLAPPITFYDDVGRWFDQRAVDREKSRVAAVRNSGLRRRL
ncbi:RrF2 family transcriptional regulator [Bradyrhizobium sp. USDA 4486]